MTTSSNLMMFRQWQRTNIYVQYTHFCSREHYRGCIYRTTWVWLSIVLRYVLPLGYVRRQSQKCLSLLSCPVKLDIHSLSQNLWPQQVHHEGLHTWMFSIPWNIFYYANLNFLVSWIYIKYIKFFILNHGCSRIEFACSFQYLLTSSSNRINHYSNTAFPVKATNTVQAD